MWLLYRVACLDYMLFILLTIANYVYADTILRVATRDIVTVALLGSYLKVRTNNIQHGLHSTIRK